MWLHRAGAIAVLSAFALGSAIGRSDDASKAPQPAAGFLEFLGSVDRLSEVNANYLSQPIPLKTVRPAANGGTRPPATQPPAPAPAPTPSGDKNDG
ncbi:MAG TPA: hypothetical protein VLV25_10050 [Steroidobacteraceae bacterium]|nr:hypothetical protein [Steroidobacteraceae bacterium]